MIKFFRHIRKSLLMENKTGKPAFAAGRYFKYAIGEIVLVVIGILIALQINNWNEGLKEKARLKIALTSVYNDLVEDSLDIRNVLPQITLKKIQNNKLIQRAYSTTANLDTIVKIMKKEFPAFWFQGITYNTNAFNNLKSTSTFDVLPEVLKKELSDYYTTVIKNEKLSTIVLDQYRTQLEGFINKYNLTGRLENENFATSYLFNASWKNIDEKDFTARASTILGTFNVLYNVAEQQLKHSLVEIKKLILVLKPFIA